MREKGTNRSRFFRGQVDKYTWVDIGSSFPPSEIIAAFLWAQLEDAAAITARRRSIWDAYHDAFAGLEARGLLRRPVVPERCTHNAHLYYLLVPDHATRTALIEHLAGAGIQAVFHYVPLHSAPAGRRFGRNATPLRVTESVSERLVRDRRRGLAQDQIDQIVEAVHTSLAPTSRAPAKQTRPERETASHA